MTLTTVGYDYNPETLLGKILGGCCALSGVNFNQLQIAILVANFTVGNKHIANFSVKLLTKGQVSADHS